MKNFDVTRVILKNSIFRGGGGFTKNQFIKGVLPEREGAWTVCRFKGRLGKKEGGLIPQCTLWIFKNEVRHEVGNLYMVRHTLVNVFDLIHLHWCDQANLDMPR